MFCNKCGVELADGSVFCNKCGAPQGSPSPASQASAEQGSAPAPAAPSTTEPAKEAEVWKGRYSGRAMGMGFVGAIVWFIALWIGWVVMTRKGSWFEDKDWFLWVIVVLSPLPLLYVTAVMLYRKLTLKYRLTTQRFFMEQGFLARRIEEVELIRVDDVAVNQGVIERMFDVGSVLIVSTDATHPRLVVTGIRAPIELKEKIRGLMKESRKRSVHFETL